MSGGGGGGGGDDGVEYQRQQEEARQARIREGMQRIDELFNGKKIAATYGVDKSAPVPKYDSGWGPGFQQGNWFREDGTPITILATSQDRRGANKPLYIRENGAKGGKWIVAPELYQRQIQLTPERIEGGFDESVFQKRAKAYEDFALPQVQQQYADQQKALTYALARGGNLQSSLASNKTAELDKDFALQKQAVIDKGQDYVNQGKSELATQKANAVSLLQASADPDAAYNVAQTSAQQLTQMPAFSPLDPVVKNVAAGLGTYLTNQQTADAIARANASYSLPSNWGGSGKVRG